MTDWEHQRQATRWVLIGAGAAALLMAVSLPLTLIGTMPTLAAAVLLEVATARRWGGVWGEKNPDGTPKYPTPERGSAG